MLKIPRNGAKLIAVKKRSRRYVTTIQAQNVASSIGGDMKNLLFFIAMLVCLSVLAMGEDRRDGNFWRELNEDDRAMYIIGIYDGISIGHNFSYWGNVKDKQAFKKFLEVDTFNEYFDKYLTNTRSDQVVDGLNELYTDFRNRKIKIMDAVWLVLYQIAGASESEMASILKNYRKNRAE